MGTEPLHTLKITEQNTSLFRHLTYIAHGHNTILHGKEKRKTHKKINNKVLLNTYSF